MRILIAEDDARLLKSLLHIFKKISLSLTAYQTETTLSIMHSPIIMTVLYLTL